jgi:hypothetical protein
VQEVDDSVGAPGEEPADLDMDRVVRWISGDAYWAKGPPPEVVERSFANSFPAGL